MHCGIDCSRSGTNMPGLDPFQIWSFARTVQWAIPEIRCTFPKEDIGISKILPIIFHWELKKKKMKHLFGRKG